MTIADRLRLHKNSIEWFIQLPSNKVWARANNGTEWCLTVDPRFYSDYTYVADDTYAKLRMARADDETIQYKGISTCHQWEDIGSGTMYPLNFADVVSSYRIKPKPITLKTGDWVRIKASNDVIQIPSNHSSSTELNCIEFRGQQYFLDDIELWSPADNEWCVVFNDDRVLYMLTQFCRVDRVGYSYKVEGQLFTNLAPKSHLVNLS